MNAHVIEKWRSSTWRRYTAAVLFVFAAAAVRLLFMMHLGPHVPYITFYPAVMFAALLGGLFPGLFATFLSFVIAAFFWIEPEGIGLEPPDWLGMTLFLVSCTLISMATEAMQRAQTHAREAEAEVRAAEERRLEEEMRLQKLEGLRVLAGGIAHDLNNMMVAVSANAGLALNALAEGEPVADYIASIVSSAHKVSDFSRQMLSITGKVEEDKSPVQLNDTVRDTVRLLIPSISKNAGIEYNLGDGLPLVLTNPQSMQRVLMNLLINASDSLGHDHGTIRISTGQLHAGRSYLDTMQPPGRPEGDYVYMEVSDTGCGMSRETTKKIFDPFFTTKFAGRGLGLPAVLGIVTAHGGAVGLESKEGRGSSFMVLLPVPAVPLEEQTERTAGSAIWEGEGRLLLVDDDLDSLSITKRILEKAGYEVLTATDGTEAVDIYRGKHQEIDAVVMDLMMPQLRGDEAAMELRKIRSDTNILLLSGYHEVELGRLMEGPGRTAVMEKPYSIEGFLETVKDLSGAGQAPVSANNNPIGLKQHDPQPKKID